MPAEHVSVIVHLIVTGVFAFFASAFENKETVDV
jgi:hypothetical protein